MTKFLKSEFNYSGGYLTYGPDRKFVARFKYNKRDKAGFVSFLIKNFTTEEYFAATAAGTIEASPAKVMEAKGYVSLTVRRLLERAGYPATTAGKEAYLNAACGKAGA